MHKYANKQMNLCINLLQFMKIQVNYGEIY